MQAEDAKLIVDKLFEELDINGDGVIEAAEIRKRLKHQLNAGDVKHFMEMDANHDGKLTREECLAYILKGS